MVNAQTPDWSVPVSGTPKQIFFNQFTQTPVLETGDKFVGINSDSKSIAWTIEKSNLAGASKAAAMITGDKSLEILPYVEVENTQFAVCTNVIFDVATGQVVLGDDATTFTKMEGYDVIPELNAVLFKVRTSDSYMAYLVDLESNKVLWGTKVGNFSATGNALKSLGEAASGRNFSFKNVETVVNCDNNIVYSHFNSLMLLNAKDGSLVWENECKPAFVRLTENGKYIISVEKAGGLTAGAAAFSKKVNCIDAVTGKNVWPETLKLDGGAFVAMAFVSNDEVLLASDRDLMLYSISTGKGLWKKSFSANFINSLAITSEGAKVSFGNKITMVNIKDGTKLWKNPIKLDGVSEEAGAFYQKDYAKSYVVLTGECVGVFNTADNKKKFTIDLDKEDKVAFDDKNNKVVVANGKKVYIISPDNDAKCPAPLKAKLDSPKEISGVYCSDKGQFVYGNKEYMMINNDMTVASQKVYPQLKTKSHAGLITLAQFAAPSSVTKGFADVTGYRSSDAASRARKQLKANNKQKKAVRADETRTVFLTGESLADGDVVKLALVDKTTGKEVSVTEFSKDRNVVYNIDFVSNVVYFYEDGAVKCLTLK